jgi:hypothetical protein
MTSAPSLLRARPRPSTRASLNGTSRNSTRPQGIAGAGFVYSKGLHIQEMKDATGEETTSKEGATNPRKP